MKFITILPLDIDVNDWILLQITCKIDQLFQCD